MNSRHLLASASFILVISSVFMVINFQKKPWPVPEAAKTKKNPVPATAASLATGKELWSTHCKSCHGSKGLGDGSKASQLNTEPGDFSKTDFQLQTDGAIFYKTSEGRDDMPGFKKKITDHADIWSIVNYLRGFRKGGAPVTVTTVKDTVARKPVTTVNPPVKKDTIIKKEIVPVVKIESIPVQEQLNRLNNRVDSLEKEIRMLKEKAGSK